MLTADERALKESLLAQIRRMEEQARARHIREASSKTYSFQDIASSEFLAELQNFQAVFGRHIPVVLESEHAAIILHSRICDSVFGNPIETIRHSTLDADLKRLRKSVQTIADHPTDYWKTLIVKKLDADPEDKVTQGAFELFDIILSIQQFIDDDLLPRVLNRYEELAREAATRVRDRRNINWEAVHAVERFRAYWEAWTARPAPRRGLNPASPFADYLRDAFDFFDIAGDPMAAFKRWAAVEGNDEVSS